MQEDREFSTSLKKLAWKIKEEIDIGRTKKSLQAETDIVIYEKITQFDYTELGIGSFQTSHQLISKLS